MLDSHDPLSDSDECMRCGACCVTFRVSFYWAEVEDLAIPEHATERVSPLFLCMAGTNSKAPRCDALQGTVGKSVQCGLYAHRPSPCRELQLGDDKCQRARARHGLPPISKMPECRHE